MCLGAHGLGPWHEEEERVLTSRRVDAKRNGDTFRIIPLILPSANESPDIPAFLRNTVAVDLRSGWSDDSLDRLCRAVSDNVH